MQEDLKSNKANCTLNVAAWHVKENVVKEKTAAEKSSQSTWITGALSKAKHLQEMNEVCS